MNTASTLDSRQLSSNTISNSKGELKAITTRSGVSYEGPPIPPLFSSLPKVVEREPEVTKDTVQPSASINLMPLSIWEKLSLPELTPTQMILELADRSTTRPASIAEDVFVKVGKFHFLIDFVVVDYVVDPRIPLILGRPFLRTGRALIDVYGEELTLRVNNEAITFKVGQTSSFSYNYAESINQIDVIDVACEEYSQEVLGFFNFLLEETNAFLDIKDEPISLEINDSYYDSEGGILLLEEFLNDDPSSPALPPQELIIVEPKNEKSSIHEPPVVELKDLSPHLEYAFLEGDDKLHVIISKDLKDEEKTALIKVFKSHKRALTWKLSDIKGFNPEFYTHKILMEDDFKLAVQHKRRVNSKIHEGGITVVKNEENEVIPTRLVIGQHMCIDYRKLNDATRKDHFPLPFMDQMLERLARNEYYCFLDGFSGYFKFPSTLKIKKRAHSRILMECLPTVACLSAYVMHRGIVLGHKISKNEIKVDKAKVDVIAKLPHPTTVKGVGSFLGHAGAVLGQRKTKPFQPIHYASKTIIDDQAHYTMTEKELLAVMEKSRNVMKCLKLPSKFTRSLTYGASISWDCSCLHEGTCTYSSRSTTCLNRFGTPRAIISDRGTHFCNDQFTKVMLKYGVNHRLATVYHPQMSGQVEVSNPDLKRNLERTAYENSLIYKEKTKRIHHSKIKDRIFNVGDRVLLFNSRLKMFSGKLKTRWTGPFTASQVFPYGIVELSQTEGPNFKVNGHTLKHYFGGDIPPMVFLNLQTFPKDQ
nr:DNA-directed DNA polymerase [Tanacetum cinerariifolium]